MRIVCVQAGSITFHIESQHKKAFVICPIERERERKKIEFECTRPRFRSCVTRSNGVYLCTPPSNTDPITTLASKPPSPSTACRFTLPFPPNPPKMPKTTLPDSLSSTSPLLNRFMVLTRQVNFLN
jgi:hypothetical protein